MTIPPLPGWHLLGAYPDHQPDDVGAWLLHHGGQAMLLEVPPGLTVGDVHEGLATLGCSLRYATASHAHEDHFDRVAWRELRSAFPAAEFMNPSRRPTSADLELSLGGEPLWLVSAPKHSPSDALIVFRGVGMTGDVELGTLRSCNREVSAPAKAASMRWFAGFADRTGYRAHTIVSAHLNDFRAGVDWAALFAC